VPGQLVDHQHPGQPKPHALYKAWLFAQPRQAEDCQQKHRQRCQVRYTENDKRRSIEIQAEELLHFPATSY
jgi:hypothetical protein